jgi:hypothetical protein
VDSVSPHPKKLKKRKGIGTKEIRNKNISVHMKSDGLGVLLVRSSNASA